MTDCIHDTDIDLCDYCTGPGRASGATTGGASKDLRFALIHAPELRKDTLLHLNVEEDRWKVRHYGSPFERPRELARSADRKSDLDAIRITLELPYPHSRTSDGVTVEDSRYWFDQIALRNGEHGIGG